MINHEEGNTRERARRYRGHKSAVGNWIFVKVPLRQSLARDEGVCEFIESRCAERDKRHAPVRNSTTRQARRRLGLEVNNIKERQLPLAALAAVSSNRWFPFVFAVAT